jgi:quercetin dioxygenase-like cupin family protein
MPATAVTEETILKPEVLATDDRGVIERLLLGDFQSVLRTTQKKGSVRANHYHRHDSHTGYVVSGRVLYMTRPVEDEAAEPTKYMVEAGQLFHTPPMLVHATIALEDADILYFTPRSGKQTDYENDVVRVELISPADAEALAGRPADAKALAEKS